MEGRRASVWTLLVASAAVGCSAPARGPEATPTPYDFASEGTFPPPPAVVPEPTSAAAPRRFGCRVQVAASVSRETAEALRDELRAHVDANVYIDFEAPYYKVRVGDCTTEQECLELRDRLRRAGYTSAWAVEAEIEAP